MKCWWLLCLLWPFAVQAVTLDEVSQRLGAVKVLRAEFTQQRTVAGLSRPLLSSGTMLLAREQGLWWHQSQPFELTVTLTPRALTQEVAGERPQRLTADDNPTLFQFSHLLASLFQADVAALQSRFAIDLMPHGDGWQMELTPRAAPLNQVFRRIRLTGGALLDEIQLEEKRGDTTRIRFVKQTTAPEALSDDERRYFSR